MHQRADLYTTGGRVDEHEPTRPSFDTGALPRGSGTAQALVSAARRHLGMDLAFLAEFAGDQRIFRFVDTAPGAVRVEVGESAELADSYCERLVNGTIPAVIPDATNEPSVMHHPATEQFGVASYVGVPVRRADGRLFGTLCCLSHVVRRDLGVDAQQYLNVIAETIAADLDLEAREPAEQSERRVRIEEALAQRSFFPVYQPIVELATGRVVGAEALTRFTGDRRGPAAWFAEAATVGLGRALEIAAAEEALAAFAADDDRYLAVNASPGALDGIADLLASARHRPRHVVVEITEHTEIGEYAQLQDLTARLRGQEVRVAVDDTGAGISSLRHILELRPDIIKLDLSLTIGIDHDPVRQALAEALAGFARRIGKEVIAEGIESRAQLEVLASVGIRLGQGFHLGRPAPLPLPRQARTTG